MLEIQRSNPWKIGFLIVAIAVVLWIGYGIIVPHLFMDWQKSSQFGDMFGGIGALFSGLALAGVVIAVLMQKEELELQREELVATREEIKRSSSAQERLAALTSLTAQLNALNTLATSYGQMRIADAGTMMNVVTGAFRKQADYLQQIEVLIQRLQEAESKPPSVAD